MDKANAIIEEMYERFGEWIEHDETGGVLLRALAATAAQEREKAEFYRMALKRCELTRK